MSRACTGLALLLGDTSNIPVGKPLCMPCTQLSYIVSHAAEDAALLCAQDLEQDTDVQSPCRW